LLGGGHRFGAAAGLTQANGEVVARHGKVGQVGGEHRLVTATGPGGAGKVAPARREGVWFVDLIQ